MTESENYLERNKKTYDEMALSFREYREKKKISIYPDVIGFGDLLIHRFGKLNVLDIGPGAGIFSHYFESRGVKTTAIDFSQKMIEVAREASPQTEYFWGNFLEYDFKKRTFEGIFAKSVIHLFEKRDTSAFFRRVKDLLSTGGLFYVSAFIYTRPREEFREKIMCGKRFTRFTKDFTRQELETLIQEEEFKEIDTFERKRDDVIEWSAILERTT